MLAFYLGLVLGGLMGLLVFSLLSMANDHDMDELPEPCRGLRREIGKKRA